MKLSSHILGLASAIMLGTALPSAVSAENRVIEISSPNMRVYLPDTAKATGRAVVALPEEATPTSPSTMKAMTGHHSSTNAA